MGDYRNIFLNFNVPTGSDFAAKSLTVGSRTVNYQIVDNNTPPGTPTSITIPSGQLFGGLNSQEYDYIVTSSATSNSDTEAKVSAEFKVGYIPLFQFVAFYTRDLEIAPGADMTLNGRVHTNADLYLDADNSTLAIADNPPSITTVQVSAAGDIYRGRKRTSTCETGTVNVDMLQDTVAPFGNLDPKTLPCNGSSTRKVLASELAAWKGSMVNQIESISVPQPDNDARGPGSYWTHADLRITLNLNKTYTPVAPLVGPTQYLIEVQNGDLTGTQDVAKTAILQRFMGADPATNLTNTNWNTANSTIPGTRPIFYTDVPITSGAPSNCNCTNGNPVCTNGVAACYTPPFAGWVGPAAPTANQNNRVYATGTTMTGTVTGTIPTGNGTAGSYRFDADFRRGGFYNWREQKWMYLLNVNVADLLAWNQAQYNANPANALFNPADNSDGGIVLFLSVQGPASGSAANNYGVRLFGSSVLPFPAIAAGGDPTGITVVSDQAIYVAGNYNMNTTLATGWQPAAVVGDSVNILSNNYFNSGNPPVATAITNDKQSAYALSDASRNATATTVNTAFIGGVDDTVAGGGSSTYNGGLENYPRFHENWGGVQFNYQGSYVSLGLPTHVNGPWCGTGAACNIYNPPVRNWNYDSQFNNAANLPPLTPHFVYVQQVLFTEEFK